MILDNALSQYGPLQRPLCSVWRRAELCHQMRLDVAAGSSHPKASLQRQPIFRLATRTGDSSANIFPCRLFPHRPVVYAHRLMSNYKNVPFLPFSNFVRQLINLFAPMHSSCLVEGASSVLPKPMQTSTYRPDAGGLETTLRSISDGTSSTGAQY